MENTETNGERQKARGRKINIHEDDEGGVDLSKVKALSIPRIATATMEVTCVGTSALIIKAWSKEARAAMLGSQMGLPKEKTRKDPNKEFMGCRYLDKKGRDYIPGRVIKKCLTSAGELVGVKRTLLDKVLFILDEEVLINCPGGPKMREDMVRNRGAMGSVADIRFRPEYTKWGFTCRVEYHKGFLTPEAVLNLFQNAGYSCGIGEMRPQKSGEFGRFEPTGNVSLKGDKVSAGKGSLA